MSVQNPQFAKQATPSTQNTLFAVLRMARRRIRSLVLLRFGSLGLLLASALAIVLVGLGKVHIISLSAPLPLGLLIVSGVLIGSICAFLPRLTDVDVAKLTERRADLKERLSSAIEFQQGSMDANAPFVSEQWADANRYARDINLRTLFPMRLPRTLYGGIVLFLLLFAAFFLPGLPRFWSPQRKQDAEDVKIAAIAIQKVADDKEKSADQQKLDESKQAAQNIKALTNKMRLGKIEKKPALVAMSKLTQKLEAQKQKLAASLPKKSMEEAAKQFKDALDKMQQDVEKSQQDKQQANAGKPQPKNGQKPQDKSPQNDPANKPNEAMKKMQQALQQMQQAMQMNDTSQMQMAMEKMAQQMQQNGPQMGAQQMQQMQQAMQQLAQAMQDTQMQQMSQQLQQLAQQMQGQLSAQQMQQLAQAMKNMAGLMKNPGKGMMTAMLDAKALEELMQALKDGKMTMLMGKGNRPGFGGKGPGSGFGGSGNPTQAMKDPGNTKARLLVANKSQWGKALGKQGDPKKFAEYLAMSSKPSKHAPNGMVMGNRTANGDELQINMTGDPDPTQSSSPYYKAYQTSKKQAESTLDKEAVPAAYKKQVKDYFDSIHP